MISGLLRTGVSLALLALLVWWLDAGALLDRLAGFDPRWVPAALALAVCGVAVGALAAFLAFRRRPRAGPLATLWRNLHTALLTRGALPAQLLSSTLIVGTFLATYVVAARAVGVSTPLWTLLPLVAPVLLSMLVPVTVVGWGVREGTAAAFWGAVGLTPVDGVAISAAYGILVLLSSLPGALVLLSSGRDRRGGHLPRVRDGTEAAATGPGPQTAAG